MDYETFKKELDEYFENVTDEQLIADLKSAGFKFIEDMNLQDFINDYLATDSISERAQLTEEIENLIDTHARKVYTLASKYGEYDLFGSDYSPDSGNWTLEEVLPKAVRMVYKDYFRGETYSEWNTFTALDVDNYNPDGIEKVYKENKKAFLFREIENAKKNLACLEAQYEVL